MDKDAEIEHLREELEKKDAELRKADEKLRDQADMRTAMLYTIEDVNQALIEVEKAKKEWEATFDAISDPLFIHDRDMMLVRVNRAYLAASGEAKFKDIIGSPYYEVFPKMEGPFRMCLKAQELQQEEEEFSCPVTNRVFKVRFYPIKNIEGKYLYSIHILEDITEAKKAAERLKEEVDVTTHLLMISEATAHTTDMDKLMEQVVYCGHEIIGCDICLSYLYDEDSRVFQPCQEFGLSRELIPVFRTEPLDEKMEFIRRAMEGREPVVDQVGAVREPPLQWIKDTSTLAALPLIGKTGPLGLIVGIYKVGADLKPAPTIEERDMKIMQGIMHQVSVALEQARLYKESIDRAMELSHKMETIQTMHQIDRSILSTLESQEILETVTRLVAKVIPCERATVALADMDRKGFTYAAGFGVGFLPKGTFVKFGDTSTTEVVETGRPQYVPNIMEIKEPLAIEAGLIKEGFLSHIRVPIMAKGEVVGILSVGAKRPSAFTPEDLSTLEKLSYQMGVALENARLISDLKELFLGTVKSLSSAIDAKSTWTAGHSERVTKYALEIGKEMGLSEKELKDLELTGLLHDIGKIGTYDVILDKPDRLSDKEQDLIKQHPVKGAEILAPIRQLKDIIPAIRHHHEFYDGTGYPDGLKGRRYRSLRGS